MIYLFTGNSRFLINEAIEDWKNKFIEKYSEFNMLHIKDLFLLDKNHLSENLFSLGLYGDKKLIIIELNNDIKEDAVDFFTSTSSRIPEDNIVIFSWSEADKRGKLFKDLSNIANKKEFDIKDENDIYSLIQKRYKDKITGPAIKLLIKYKANNLEKIVSEIEKLLITSSIIDNKIIEDNIIPELEESIFLIIDDILNKKIFQSIEKIEIMINEINIYALYNGLLANLRTNLYIMKLIHEGINSNEIASVLNLGNRAFLINKKYKITYEELANFFVEFVNLDKKMKTGNMLGTEDKDFLLEIERVLMEINS